MGRELMEGLVLWLFTNLYLSVETCLGWSQLALNSLLITAEKVTPTNSKAFGCGCYRA